MTLFRWYHKRRNKKENLEVNMNIFLQFTTLSHRAHASKLFSLFLLLANFPIKFDSFIWSNERDSSKLIHTKIK